MDVSTLVPAGGLGLVIVLLVGYLLKQLVTDRADYRATIVEEQQRTKAAEARAAAERNRAEKAQAKVDEERELRRTAEAGLAVAEGKLAVQQQMLAWSSVERSRLQRYVPPPVGGILPDPSPQLDES